MVHYAGLEIRRFTYAIRSEHLHAVLIYFPTVLYVPTYQVSGALPTNNNTSYSYDITWHLTLFLCPQFFDDLCSAFPPSKQNGHNQNGIQHILNKRSSAEDLHGSCGGVLKILKLL